MHKRSQVTTGLWAGAAHAFLWSPICTPQKRKKSGRKDLIVSYAHNTSWEWNTIKALRRLQQIWIARKIFESVVHRYWFQEKLGILHNSSLKADEDAELSWQEQWNALKWVTGFEMAHKLQRERLHTAIPTQMKYLLAWPNFVSMGSIALKKEDALALVRVTCST